ncbi:efflux RND transporter permease subunit [Flavobacteriaceae bacterium]|nr:efflux RND transporter permease subunit [Flavobacteriaceae bacterium]
MAKTSNSSEKEFLLSSWAIRNSNTMYVFMVVLLFLGISAYLTMPRENFPEITETNIYISTPYPGNTAEDIERFVTDPLEEAVKGVSNVVEITSTSQDDYSMVVLEFDEDINVNLAKQKVKDEVDAVVAGEDWPTFNNAKLEPNVFDLNFVEEFPIVNVTLQGDYTLDALNDYAELLEQRIERLDQIKEVDIRGTQEREVEVAVDIHKMMASKVSFGDVIQAIRNENSTVSAGSIISNDQRRNIRVIGEIQNPSDLGEFVVKNELGAIYLKDISTIRFKDMDATTHAREFGQSVVMLDVKKRGGKNLIQAAEAIRKIVDNARSTIIPQDVEVAISNDTSTITINQVNDLINNILFGVLLVVTVLTFFLGFRNALFVGFAIPMSMFISFFILQSLGYTMNTMVLFALVMGLGMLVDNGIVVVENVYRLIEKEGMPRFEAAKKGVSEIAFPIIISTATTVAAFVPLGFWPGIMGQFMIYFPITLSVVLGSSLIVAIFFNSVLVSQFMDVEEKILSRQKLIRITLILGGLGILVLFNGGAIRGLGSLLLFIVLLFWIYKYVLKDLANRFRTRFLVWLEIRYERLLRYAMRGRRAYAFVFGTVLMLIFSFVLVGISQPKVEFFPDNQPTQIIIYIEYPQGTDIAKTDEITKSIEQLVIKTVNQPKYIDDGYNFMVESLVSQVGAGAGNPQTEGGSEAEMPHRGKITATMREFKFRRGLSSENLRREIQQALAGTFAGVSISVEKDQAGPPLGYPINIEVTGDNYGDLIEVSERMRNFIINMNIPGIEELKVDVNRNKPGMRIAVDRQKAGELGVSAGQIGFQLRQSLFGEKAGVYKKDGEDYNINVRFQEKDRYNQSALFNQYITFRDMASGQIKSIPVAAVTDRKNTSGYSAIKHRSLERVVTVYSAILPGYNAAEIVNQIKTQIDAFQLPANMRYRFTGEIEEQEENMSFLSSALLYALFLILVLLVLQFNSVSKPFIILFSIFMSFTGVLLGLVVFNMTFVIIMTMMGIISLAGIVVNNSVVLLDYTQLLLDRRRDKHGLEYDYHLDRSEIFNAIVNGGKARLRPVLLTAITTVLGLIPLAVGLNINFFSLFTTGDPQIYIGGDNVIFWGPLAWTVIFGLTFATFLTLVIVPVAFYLSKRAAIRFNKV